MIKWTPTSIKQAVSGRWLIRAPEHEQAPLSGFGVDSRSIERGEVFFAIRGARFDGHQFIGDAIEAGAPLVIADDGEEAKKVLRRSNADAPVLVVRDTVKALGDLASAHRRELDGVHVVTVCGSNGKTTTVRLLECILGASLSGSTSPRSFNNEIGLPLSVLTAKAGDDFLVCEAGCNAPGEIAALGAVAQPNTAVITSIGRAHMENFASVDDVAREDASMFAHLRPGGTAIMPAGFPVLEDHSRPVPHVIRFGEGPGADVPLGAVEHAQLSDGRFGIRAQVVGGPLLELPLIGKHNALNALTALATARVLGMSDDDTARAMKDAHPADLRLEQRRLGGIGVMLDCYNANPESMRSAVSTFTELADDPAHRVLVLGDMLELGEIGPAMHREIGAMIAEKCRARMIVTIGPLALLIAEEVARVQPSATFVMHADLTVEGADRIASAIRDGDQMLIKGSRGIRLERVLLALERRLMREKRLTAA